MEYLNQVDQPEICFNPEEWTLEKLYDGFYHILNCDYDLEDPHSRDISYLLREISKIFNVKLPGIPHNGILANSQSFTRLYRIVKWNSLPSLVENGWYPPISYSKLNRCNFNGCPVFYASDDISTALRETQLRVNDKILLGIWHFHHKEVYVFPFISTHINIPPEIKTKYDLSNLKGRYSECGIKILMHLEKIKTQLLLSTNMLTSSYISHSILNDIQYKNQSCLIYPSHTNFQKNNNFAIHQDVVDQGKVLPMKFYFGVVKDLNFQKEKIIIEMAGEVSEDKKINWRKLTEDEIKNGPEFLNPSS
ncbi:MAG: hypothetical protein ABIT08_05855 [Bacteroidia bacterium]